MPFDNFHFVFHFLFRNSLRIVISTHFAFNFDPFTCRLCKYVVTNNFSSFRPPVHYGGAKARCRLISITHFDFYFDLFDVQAVQSRGLPRMS